MFRIPLSFYSMGKPNGWWPTGRTDTAEKKKIDLFCPDRSAFHTHATPAGESATGEAEEDHGRQRRSSDGEAAAGARPSGGRGGGGGAVQVPVDPDDPAEELVMQLKSRVF